MDAEGLAKLLAYAHGDLRDWPVACGWCGSDQLDEKVRDDPDHCRCRGCGRYTSQLVAHEQREERAQAELGVPGRAAAKALATAVLPYVRPEGTGDDDPAHDPFVEATRALGMTIAEPKRDLRCRLFGCDLPGPNVLEDHVDQRDEHGVPTASHGTVGEIECRRCHRRVGPMDRDYPTIHPGGVWQAR